MRAILHVYSALKQMFDKLVPGRNLVHGSDSAESAEREIGLWFQPSDDVINWNPVLPQVLEQTLVLEALETDQFLHYCFSIARFCTENLLNIIFEH